MRPPNGKKLAQPVITELATVLAHLSTYPALETQIHQFIIEIKNSPKHMYIKILATILNVESNRNQLRLFTKYHLENMLQIFQESTTTEALTTNILQNIMPRLSNMLVTETDREKLQDSIEYVKTKYQASKGVIRSELKAVELMLQKKKSLTEPSSKQATLDYSSSRRTVFCQVSRNSCKDLPKKQIAPSLTAKTFETASSRKASSGTTGTTVMPIRLPLKLNPDRLPL